MANMAEGIQRAIEYIEDHITEDMSIDDIAARAYASAYHFQRMFGVLCGYSVGEYIRSRRLTIAAEELCATNARIIDIALKYGYDSHESFTRAFTRFHGITPSLARAKGAPLRAFGRLRIKLTLEGGSMMEYRMVDKAAFTVTGSSKTFGADTAGKDIPAFWDEFLSGSVHGGMNGMFGICMGRGTDFEYMIAESYESLRDVPEGCAVRTIPAGTWAVFPVKGAIPEALQAATERIWNEWLPNSTGFRLAGDYDIEWYPALPGEYSEIWIPVTRV